MKKILLTILIFVVVIIAASATYIKFGLPDVGDAEDLKIDLTSKRVERGKYLANHVTVCMDCHSKRDWGRYSGPLREGTFGQGGELFDEKAGFPGIFYSKNITPYGLEGWTDGELLRVITTGVGKDGKAMFPVMPYHNYGKMDREDIYSIIAYLRSLPPIVSVIPERQVDFPMSFIVNTIPEKANFQKLPPKSDTLRYGAYMVNAAGCMECHTPVKRGQIIPELAFSGGRDFNLPFGHLYSANITFDEETGIGNWTADDFVTRFKSFSDPDKLPLIKEKDRNTIMPWTMYSGMDTSDLRAIYAYLRTVKPIRNKVAHFVDR